MFGRLKDWRRVATRYGRSANLFFSAVTLAATVIFLLWSTGPDARPDFRTSIWIQPLCIYKIDNLSYVK